MFWDLRDVCHECWERTLGPLSHVFILQYTFNKNTSSAVISCSYYFTWCCCSVAGVDFSQGMKVEFNPLLLYNTFCIFEIQWPWVNAFKLRQQVDEIQYVRRVGFSSNLWFAVHCGGIPITLWERAPDSLCSETLESSCRPSHGGPHDIVSGWGTWKSGHSKWTVLPVSLF